MAAMTSHANLQYAVTQLCYSHFVLMKDCLVHRAQFHLLHINIIGHSPVSSEYVPDSCPEASVAQLQPEQMSNNVKKMSDLPMQS